jgi:WD40 repeat protein
MFTDGSLHTDLDHIKEFQARWEYARPNFISLSENEGRYFVNESGDDNVAQLWLPEGVENEDFILLSDHNRSTAPFGIERIGARKRMINGDMRAYHVADKLSVTLSWDDIPSRSYSSLNGYSDWVADPSACTKFTVDGGAGGVDMLKWYNGHKGSMWAFFSFDNISSSAVHGDVAFRGYGRVYEMMITDFEYEVSKRGGLFKNGLDTYAIDLWNVSMTLEEV